jgi:F0F1-type ATP synthase assembly protein I
MIEWFYSFLITVSIIVAVGVFIGFYIYLNKIMTNLPWLLLIILLMLCLMTRCTYEFRNGNIISQEQPHGQS